LGTGPVRSLNHMRIDKDASQALHTESLDEAHAAHVRGQIIDFRRSLANAPTGVLRTTIEAKMFRVGKTLIPFPKRFLIHCADTFEALITEIFDQMSADEATGTGDNDENILRFPFGAIGSGEIHIPYL